MEKCYWSVVAETIAASRGVDTLVSRTQGGAACAILE